jgi:hypothetical protein
VGCEDVKVSVQVCAGRLLLPGRLRGPFLSRPHASDRGPQRLGVSYSSETPVSGLCGPAAARPRTLYWSARMRVTVALTDSSSPMRDDDVLLALSDSESLTPHRQCETMPRTTSCWLQLAWAACSVACPSHSPDQAPKSHLARLSGDPRIAFCWHPLARYRPGDVPAGHRPGDVPVPLRPSQCSDVHRAVTGLLWPRTHGMWPPYFHVLLCTVQSRFFCPGVCGRRPAGGRSARWREGGATPATAGPGGPGRRQPPRVSSPLR